MRVHATQGLLFSVLAAHDEDRKGCNVPFPAAAALGQPPRSVATSPPSDDIELSRGDPPGGELDKPASGDTSTAAAALSVPQGDCSMKDLHIGQGLAHQTYLARYALPLSRAVRAEGV